MRLGEVMERMVLSGKVLRTGTDSGNSQGGWSKEMLSCYGYGVWELYVSVLLNL